VRGGCPPRQLCTENNQTIALPEPMLAEPCSKTTRKVKRIADIQTRMQAGTIRCV
jgi:hypothetical protein